MATMNRFAILLYTDNPEYGVALGKFIKPVFPLFFIANSEAEATKIIVKENIDILFMGLSSIAANESGYLHLITNKDVRVEEIIRRKFILCSQKEIRDAFSICNKEIFDDYFVIQPFNDPYRILIRMRFLMRLFRKEDQEKIEREQTKGALGVEEMCAFFDQIIHCEQSFSQLNDQNFRRLFSTITAALEVLKKGINDSDMTEKQRDTLMLLLEEHAEKSLLEEVESQHKQQQQMSYKLQNVSERAQVKKQQTIAPIDIDFTGLDVLVVEDEENVRTTITDALLSSGCQVQSASTAKEAGSILESVDAQVMLLDLTLPDMTPFFVIGKALELTPQIKIFLLARPVDRGNVEECLKAGATDVLIKPIDEYVLLHKLQALLGLTNVKGQ